MFIKKEIWCLTEVLVLYIEKRFEIKTKTVSKHHDVNYPSLADGNMALQGNMVSPHTMGLSGLPMSLARERGAGAWGNGPLYGRPHGPGHVALSLSIPLCKTGWPWYALMVIY